MAAHGAALQNHNNELVKCLEDLRDKREEINKQVMREEEEKTKIQNDLTVLTKRLAQINDSIARKVSGRMSFYSGDFPGCAQCNQKKMILPQHRCHTSEFQHTIMDLSTMRCTDSNGSFRS